MPVNEFDQSVRPEYVSNRLAIPFNELNAMASQHQKEYDNAEDSAYKFKDLMASVKAIHDPSLGLSNVGAKDALYLKYAPRIEAISNEIAKGNNVSEATRKLTQLQREWVNDPTRVELENSYGNYTKYVEDKTNKGDKYAVYKDKYRDTPLLDEKGTLKPFRFSGMGDVQDHAEEARAQMKDIAKSGYDSKNSQLAADGNIYTKDSHGEYVLDTRVDQLAEEKVVPFIQTEKGKDYLELIKYQNPNASQEDIFKQVKSYLKAAGANQIFKDIGGGNTVDVTGLSLKKYDESKEAEGFNRLPMQELPVKTPGDITDIDGLNVFGLGTNVDAKGEFIFKNFELNPNGVTPLSVKGGDRTKAVPAATTKYNTEKMVQFYTGLNNTAKQLGITIPKDSNGKTDYKALQVAVASVGKNMLINGEVGQGLQTELSNNMTSYYLGNMDSKGESFEKSPFLETSSITEVGGKQASVVDEEAKNNIAKNGIIKDINFYAEKPGTFVITSNEEGKSKNYNIYLGEKVSKSLIEPTWNLTRSFEENMMGKLNPTIQKNAEKHELELGANLAKQYNSIKDKKLKTYLMDNLKHTLESTKGMKTTSVVNSAEVLENGNPKYIFIGKQDIDEETYKPVNTVIVVNSSNGNIEIKDLNEVQAMESSFIQQQISRGYKPKLRKDE